MDDLPKGPDQLYPVLVVGGGPIPLLVLFDDPHSGVGEELEGGPDLFGSRDVVGVLHAYDDPPNVLRRLHGPIGAFEGSDDCEEGLSGANAILNGFVEEVKPVVLEGPGPSQESKGLLRVNGVPVPAVEELDEVADSEGGQVSRLSVVDEPRVESRGNHDRMVDPSLGAVLVHISDLKGVDSPVTPSFHFDNDVFRGLDLHVGDTPSLDLVSGTPQLREGLRAEFLEFLVGSSVRAGRPEFVGEGWGWSVVFVVDRVDTLPCIG